MQRDYSKLPARVSSLAGEIENKRVLQTEQIRQANLSMEYLLYYLSGGNEKPGFAIKDKVRAEDQDLRGWFTEKYGSNYIDYLTSDLQCAIDNPSRVAKIQTDFNETPFGFILRTGAVNDYHLGRIVTHAKNVNAARNEAKKYSKELAILCGKLLLTGEAPNNNIFTIMHSSIRIWYKMQGKEVQLDFESHIARASVTAVGPAINHTSYLAQIIFALFDMNAFSAPKESWHVTSGTEVTTEMIKNMLESIDGAGPLTMVALERTLKPKTDQLTELLNSKQDMENDGWDQHPVVTQELKTAFQNMVAKLDELGVSGDEDGAAVRAEAAKEVGDELSRNVLYQVRTSRYIASFTVKNTDDLFTEYDAYKAKESEANALSAEIIAKRTEVQASLEGGQGTEDFHKVRAIEIYESLPIDIDGVVTSYKENWVKYVYYQVREAYGLNYQTSSFRLGKSAAGVDLWAPFPSLIIPVTYGQAVTKYTPNNASPVHIGGIDIGKTILFYAKALSGVNPTAYWSNTLSHRLVIRPVGASGKAVPAHTKVYLYSANMKTGGIKTSKGNYTLITEVLGNRDSASVAVGAFLPDVPLYSPGTNIALNSDLDSAFKEKVSADNAFQQWLKTPAKPQFTYAYVIKSAWDPVYPLRQNWTTRLSPTFLLGTRASANLISPTPVSSSNPPILNGHMDWLVADGQANHNYKGVKTFIPNLETLMYDPVGNKIDNPAFFQARGALSSTKMVCVAFPKSNSEKILGFMKSVPAKIEELLNRVNDKPNSPQYDAKTKLSPNLLYGERMAIQRAFAEYMYDVGGGNGEPRISRFDTSKFLNDMEPLRKFLLNRTESLFIDDVPTTVKKAYDDLVTNKKTWKLFDMNGNVIPRRLLLGYNENNFGNAYKEYMGLLGAIAYLNSYEMLTDTPQHRNYAEWAKPFKGEVDRILSPLLSGVTPVRIYEDTINDTEDVVNIHKTLSALGAFQDMVELPVFDIEEFNIKWKKLGADEGAITSSPFASDGFVDVGLGGLKAGAYKGLEGGYGDVFYQTIFDIAILRPVIKQSLSNYYMYSSLRIPVNTRGVSSKVYGMRPGTSLAFTTGANLPVRRMNLVAGSSGITYPKMAGAAGVVFAGMLGMAMWKNISSETAFSDKRFKTDDSD